AFAGGDPVPVGALDQVVLALPPTRLGAVLPWMDLPRDDSGILNAHFVVPDSACLAKKPPVTGTIGSKTHWIFIRNDVVSLTISAADKLGLMEQDPEALIPVLWDETRRALDLGDMKYTAARINKERRATFDQSIAGVARRPAAKTPLKNMVLCGDATQTGLPATIEGAIRSGHTAARLITRETA
ncbi:MAG: FAD-dependent oxidoreductase, partial [Pseudomonadota bacterium]